MIRPELEPVFAGFQMDEIDGRPWGVLPAGDYRPSFTARGGRGGADFYCDDGYSFMDIVRGWFDFRPNANFGEWPYNVFAFRTLPDGIVARLAYQEGTTWLEVFDGRDPAIDGLPTEG